MNYKLSHYVSLERRYTRSINLERDLDNSSALDGYILTEKALDTLRRILTSFNNKNSNNCWTLTGVYGTGKSAFAHYFISLLAPQIKLIKQQALTITETTLSLENDDYQALVKNIPEQG